MIKTTHENCPACEWLASEAEHMATAFGDDSWISTNEEDGITHTAHYTRKDTK